MKKAPRLTNKEIVYVKSKVRLKVARTKAWEFLGWGEWGYNMVDIKRRHRKGFERRMAQWLYASKWFKPE